MSRTSAPAPGWPRRSPAPAPPRSRLLQTRIPDQMLGRQPLRVVLRAAECVEIQRRRHRVRQRDLDDLGVNTSQPQPLPQHHRVAAVAVRAHHVGQHQPDPHRRLSHDRQRSLQLKERGVVRDHLDVSRRTRRDGRHGVVHQRVVDARIPQPHRQIRAAFTGRHHRDARRNARSCTSHSHDRSSPSGTCPFTAITTPAPCLSTIDSASCHPAGFLASSSARGVRAQRNGAVPARNFVDTATPPPPPRPDPHPAPPPQPPPAWRCPGSRCPAAQSCIGNESPSGP